MLCVVEKMNKIFIALVLVVGFSVNTYSQTDNEETYDKKFVLSYYCERTWSLPNMFIQIDKFTAVSTHYHGYKSGKYSKQRLPVHIKPQEIIIYTTELGKRYDRYFIDRKNLEIKKGTKVLSQCKVVEKKAGYDLFFREQEKLIKIPDNNDGEVLF